MDGYRYAVERNKLLIWLEEEKRKLAELSAPERLEQTKDLEREFDRRMAGLYQKGKQIFSDEKGPGG